MARHTGKAGDVAKKAPKEGLHGDPVMAAKAGSIIPAERIQQCIYEESDTFLRCQIDTSKTGRGGRRYLPKEPFGFHSKKKKK